MKNKTMRTFVVDGKEMQFNLTFFNNIFKTKAKQEKKGIGEFEEELADAIFVEKSTVHAWRNRVNGPSDLDKVQQIAEFFKLEVKDFLLEVEEMMIDNTVVEEKEEVKLSFEFGARERDAFKRVYVEMLHFMRMRKKHDEELLKAAQDYFMTQNAWDELTIEEKNEYFEMGEDYDEATLDGHLYEIEKKWEPVDFDEQLEKVSEVLQEELVDLPRMLYIALEVFIANLEQTNSDDVDVEHYSNRNDYSQDAIEDYKYSCIEEIYYRNEKIFSGIEETFRTMLLYKLKN